jgi:UDP-N-acetylmuramate-alanine ligase
LEWRGTWRGATLIDDYAHHPTAVAATLATVRQMYPGRRVWCVFQPHQASRTARLLDELAVSLQNADRIAVAEIFRAREPQHRPGDVTAAMLAERTRKLRSAVERRESRRLGGGRTEAPNAASNVRDAPSGTHLSSDGDVSDGDVSAGDVIVEHEMHAIGRRLADGLCPGDVLVTMGAGDIGKLCDEFADRSGTFRKAG